MPHDPLKDDLSEALLDACDLALLGWERRTHHETKIIGVDARHRQYKVIVDQHSPARYFTLDFKEVR